MYIEDKSQDPQLDGKKLTFPRVILINQSKYYRVSNSLITRTHYATTMTNNNNRTYKAKYIPTLTIFLFVGWGNT